MIDARHNHIHDYRMIIPAPLQIGDTIGVMSPSSYITPNDLTIAIRIVEGYGYKIHVHEQTLSKEKQLAGTNTEKLNAFHDLIKNPDIKAIIFSCGGNGALDWVNNIDFDLVKANPKIIMGFSDTTSILNIINAKTGLVTFHGPTLRWFMAHEDNKTDIQQCFEVLSGNTETIKDLISGSPLVGGNASVLQYLINDINFDGKTLFLEDINIETSRLDLIFMHLKRQNIFKQISGLVLGQFDNLLDTGRPYDMTLDDIVAKHIPNDLPIIKNAPFGHGDRLVTLPIGESSA